jgi:hypothetical protein
MKSDFPLHTHKGGKNKRTPMYSHFKNSTANHQPGDHGHNSTTEDLKSTCARISEVEEYIIDEALNQLSSGH